MKSVFIVLTICLGLAVSGCASGQSNATTTANLPAPSPSLSPSPLPSPSPASSPMSLLEVGEYSGEYIKAKSGETWLGLYLSEGGSSLISSPLVIKLVEGPDDVEPGQKTGKEVDVKRADKPLFLVNGITGLRPGAVTTTYRGSGDESPQLTFGATFPLKLGDREYLLKVVSERGNSQECPDCLPVDARLVLESGTSTQVLYDLEPKLKELNEGKLPDTADIQGWYLLWAGDLDRDGKLDLYLNVSHHEYVSGRVLFLSSPARAGQSVKEVARFETAGD